MRRLNLLQTILALALAAGLAACAGGRAKTIRSPSAAEKFAVALANDRCEHDFGKRPFRTGRFPAARSGDRWLWGWLDAESSGGFTSQVSFHADRTGPVVRVYPAGGRVDLEDPMAR